MTEILDPLYLKIFINLFNLLLNMRFYSMTMEYSLIKNLYQALNQALVNDLVLIELSAS